MFTYINIYPLNNKTDHISEKYIFIGKKAKQKLIFSQIRISRNEFEELDPDLDPYQNETDPKHWL